MNTLSKIKQLGTSVFLARVVFFLPILLLIPAAVHAQGVFRIFDIFQNDILSILVGFLISLGLIYFLWGVSKYVGGGDNEAHRTEGKQMMINGIIALFVMVSVWGLVAVLVDTFGTTQTRTPFFPKVR